MIDEQQSLGTEPRAEVKSGWTVVSFWTGIYLLRLLCGILAGLIFLVVSSAVGFPRPSEDDFTRLLSLFAFAFVLIVASVTFLPLWRRLEKVSIRGSRKTLRVARSLLIPAILFQLYATFRGEMDLVVISHLVTIGVCFLVTLSLDLDRRIQFLLLLVAGSQAIVFGLAVLILGPMTPTDAWEVTAALWAGMAPAAGLVFFLFHRCQRVLSDAPGGLQAEREETE
ncbi:MAG: hypothetical protein AAF491_00030 [Verrucomicrobiota bacterium]